ncbi:butyrophilin subfamily 1 member A1-like [Alligator mississippiensis]|uniref:Butyrophilin subfamily 1 member A1-like n=1 Tax=Alligator mississippiensis TaxID=8496 RepID=A0A151MM61_ALLMI|nr:butyrophilin subfamily 1 member A1-like [Alligator mississippiensis]
MGSCCLLWDAVAVTICLLCVQTSASDSGSDPLLHIMIDDSGGIRVTCLSAGWYPEPQLLWTNSRGETLSPDSQEKDSSDRGLFNLSSSVVLTKSSDPVLSCTVRPSAPGLEKKTSISITGLFPQSPPEKAVLWVLLTVALLFSLLGAYLFRRFRKEHEEASKELEWRQFLKTASLSAAEVTLNEDTAYPYLILSKDRRSVTHWAIWQDVPQTTKRFSCLPGVLASKSFTSGKWYWDVEVGSWDSWAIGMAKESVERMGMRDWAAPAPHSKMLLLLLSLALGAEPGAGALRLNSTEGCEIIHPPRDGGIRYRGLTPDQVQTVRFLPFNYEIEYVCRPDREIVGPKVRQCLRNGTWTDMSHPSRCLRMCPKIHLSLENGRAVPQAMERVPVEGTWVEYHCNSGFRLVGSSRSNCTKAGRWTSPKPICELRRSTASGSGLGPWVTLWLCWAVQVPGFWF